MSLNAFNYFLPLVRPVLLPLLSSRCNVPGHQVDADCLRRSVVSASVTGDGTAVRVTLQSPEASSSCGLFPCNFTDLPLDQSDDPPVALVGGKRFRDAGGEKWVNDKFPVLSMYFFGGVSR